MLATMEKVSQMSLPSSANTFLESRSSALVRLILARCSSFAPCYLVFPLLLSGRSGAITSRVIVVTLFLLLLMAAVQVQILRAIPN